MVAVAHWLGEDAEAMIESQLDQWQPTGRQQRIRVAILAGELVGPDAALQRLRQARTGGENAEAGPSSEEPSNLDLLIRLYRDYATGDDTEPSLLPAQQDRLRTELGWFGKLALSPPGGEETSREQVLDAARSVMFTIIAVVTAWGFLAFLGMFVLVYVLALLFTGKLTRLDDQPRHGPVYVQTFAIWLVTYVLLGLLLGQWFGKEAGLLASLIAMGISLLSLLWPATRGVSWKTIREDLGWARGRSVARECVAGLGCYLMSLPLIVLAYVITTILLTLTGGESALTEPPLHPVVERQVNAGPLHLVQLAVVACIIAPVVEETMFRGLLFRHLREATSRWRNWASVLFSAVITSLVFALIHPQGFLAVPGIFAIAMAFALTRQWRDSLIAPIIGHGINNAVTLVLLFALLGG
jgi:membrane protease YdiL (CAAX protease family)